MISQVNPKIKSRLLLFLKAAEYSSKPNSVRNEGTRIKREKRMKISGQATFLTVPEGSKYLGFFP
jgi:hypothetical protein